MAFQIVCVSLKHRLYGSVYEGNAAFYEGNAAFVQTQIKRWTRGIEGRCKGFPIEDRKAIAYEFDFRNEVLIHEKKRRHHFVLTCNTLARWFDEFLLRLGTSKLYLLC